MPSTGSSTTPTTSGDACPPVRPVRVYASVTVSCRCRTPRPSPPPRTPSGTRQPRCRFCMLGGMPASTPFAFDGFASPSYTQVPDELFDVLMPSLPDAELRVLLYIVRRTFGFKRDADAISLSQMVSGIVTRDGRRLDAGTGLSKA